MTIGTDMSVAQLHTLADHQRAEIERLTERCQRMEAFVQEVEANNDGAIGHRAWRLLRDLGIDRIEGEGI